MDGDPNARWDLSRLALQFVLLLWALLACFCLFWVPILRIAPWDVPSTLYSDTFGPTENLWNFEPPLMDRSRYETQGNMWRPIMCPPEQWLGWAQDLGSSAWNSGARAIWLGPMHMRLVALGAVAFVNFVVYALSAEAFAAFVPITGMVRWYVCKMPESLLTLAQLDFARKEYGRKLSIEYMILFTEYYAGK